MKISGLNLFSIVFLLLSAHWASAQHCGYCNGSIQVFYIHDESDSEPISGLKVYLLDSLDKPVLSHFFDQKTREYKMDTFFLYQNPSTRKNPVEKVLFNPVNSRQTEFWFAQDNYIFYPNHEAYDAVKIVVEDIDGNKNGGKFKTKEFDFHGQPFYPLCTSASDWNLDANRRAFVKGYEPIEVILEKE